MPSYKSVLIENYYFLDVLCDIDGCTCLACNGCCGKYPGYYYRTYLKLLFLLKEIYFIYKFLNIEIKIPVNTFFFKY